MYVSMLVMPKENRINVRTTEQIKRDLEIAARLKGLTVSALVNSLVVSSIREEKERDPQAFKPKGVPVGQITVKKENEVKKKAG